jgi:general secretion pathway protein L
MPESLLIIALPQQALTPASELAFVLLVDGEVVEDGRVLPAALPKLHERGHEVVALAPARVLSWHQVLLPEGVGAASPRLKQVLGGLLEDELLDDPASLHFALAPAPSHAPDGLHWVAACERRWLAMAVQGLQLAGCPVTRILPQWGPPGAGWLHLSGGADALQLTVIGPTNVTELPCSPDNLAWALQAGAPTAAMTGHASAIRLRITAEPELAELAAERLQQPVAALPRSQRWAEAAAPSWDLARALLLRRDPRRSSLEWLRAPRWATVRWAGTGLLAVNLLGLNALAWQQTQQLDAQRVQVKALLTRTFPQARVMLEAPLQMQREVAQLARATAAPAAADLDAMLSALSASLPAGHTPQAIDYRAGQLGVSGLSLSGPEHSALLSALRLRGYISTPGAQDAPGQDRLVLRSALTP